MWNSVRDRINQVDVNSYISFASDLNYTVEYLHVSNTTPKYGNVEICICINMYYIELIYLKLVILLKTGRIVCDESVINEIHVY